LVTAERAACNCRPGGPATPTAEHQVTVAGFAARNPDVLTERRRPLGAIGDDVADLQRGHAVDQGLMGLGVERQRFLARPSIRYISHSGRERSSGRDPSRAISSCSCVAARRWQRGSAHVIGDVELRVVDHTGRASPGDLPDLPIPRNLGSRRSTVSSSASYGSLPRGLRRIDSDPTYIGVEVFSSW
jgi:hypothetical protein